MPTEFTLVARPAAPSPREAPAPPRPLPLALVAGACMASGGLAMGLWLALLVLTLTDPWVILLLILALPFLLCGVLGLIVGWMLWNGAGWARFAAMALAALFGPDAFLVFVEDPAPLLVQGLRLLVLLPVAVALLLPSSAAYCRARKHARRSARSPRPAVPPADAPAR